MQAAGGEWMAFEHDYPAALSRTYGALIPQDPLPPTFGGHIPAQDAGLNAQGLLVVKHVLCILAHDHPNLEYCPALPALVCLLAHHAPGPDALLGWTARLVRQHMQASALPASAPSSYASLPSPTSPGSASPPVRYLPTSWAEVRQMQRAFGALLYREHRKLHAHVTELQAKAPAPLWAGWLEVMFLGTLPLPCVWRVLDCFLIEGASALLRHGVALVLLVKEEVLRTKDYGSLQALFAHPTSAQLVPHPPPHQLAGALGKLADRIKVRGEGEGVGTALVHHPSLRTTSGVEGELGEGPKYRYQRATPKFLGLWWGGGSSSGSGGSGGSSHPHAQAALEHALKSRPEAKAIAPPTPAPVLREEHWIALWSWIPPQKRIESIELAFTTREHGCLLDTLYARTRERKALILVVESMEGALFGAYLSTPWPAKLCEGAFEGGNGECFLFSLAPSAKLYPWVGRSDVGPSAQSPGLGELEAAEYLASQASMFVKASRRSLTIGGGG